jgi:hypothetical protein
MVVPTMQPDYDVFPMQHEIVLELAWINELMYLLQEYEVRVELMLVLILKSHSTADLKGGNTAGQ